ncbi:uncharacterized protein LOC127152089 isoform X1 [Labeo rohita]|uniref:uncharacterized protein LOC127152089 isoform X1 n=1 Tax=Labeo rohita TaxID=84645 RepID=UPI0021E25452|nr:uncharacterized protein LOC127152089 isoform X1 [Labeo rohita]
MIMFCHKMHLRDSIVLLFILLTGGFCLDCYDCDDKSLDLCEEKTCNNEESMCASITIEEVEDAGFCVVVTVTTEKRCAMLEECKPWSTKRTRSKSVSVQCCNTNLCNKPDYYSYENRRRCFTCDKEDCSYEVFCQENEDYCFTAYKNHSQYQPQTVKGCASTNFCYNKTEGLDFVGNVTCCWGNLCNGAQSVTQIFLFLCCSLLSFILLH